MNLYSILLHSRVCSLSGSIKSCVRINASTRIFLLIIIKEKKKREIKRSGCFVLSGISDSDFLRISLSNSSIKLN